MASTDTNITHLVQMIDWRVRQMQHCVQMQMAGFSRQIDYSFKKLGSDIGKVSSEMASLRENVIQDREDIWHLQEDRDCIFERIEALEEAMETKEREAKRNNLKFFGVQEPPRFRMSTAEQIVEMLNNYSAPEFTFGRRWSLDDIARAFRIQGSKRYPDEPRPIIVQFLRGDDKMEILRDKDLRDAMREDNIRVTADLTTHQHGLVDFHRKQGKIAFFKQGNLHVLDRNLHNNHSGAKGYNTAYRTESSFQGRSYHHHDDSQHRAETQHWPRLENLHEVTGYTNVRNSRQQNERHGLNRTGQRKWNDSLTYSEAHRETMRYKESRQETRRTGAQKSTSAYQKRPLSQQDNTQEKRTRHPLVVPGELPYNEVVKTGPPVNTHHDQPEHRADDSDSDEGFHLFDDFPLQHSQNEDRHEREIRRIAADATFTVSIHSEMDNENAAKNVDDISERNPCPAVENLQCVNIDPFDNKEGGAVSLVPRGKAQDNSNCNVLEASYAGIMSQLEARAPPEGNRKANSPESLTPPTGTSPSVDDQHRPVLKEASPGRSPRPRTRSAVSREARSRTADDATDHTQRTGIVSAITRGSGRSRSQSTITDAFSRTSKKDNSSALAASKDDNQPKGGERQKDK